jgi:hypothetical protein
MLGSVSRKIILFPVQFAKAVFSGDPHRFITVFKDAVNTVTGEAAFIMSSIPEMNGPGVFWVITINTVAIGGRPEISFMIFNNRSIPVKKRKAGYGAEIITSTVIALGADSITGKYFTGA